MIENNKSTFQKAYIQNSVYRYAKFRFTQLKTKPFSSL